MKNLILFFSFLLPMIISINAQTFDPDVYNTSKGTLKIYFVGHGTLMFDFNGKIIHVDPWAKLTDYSKLSKADIILITHQHGDHYDTAAINQIMTKKTSLVVNGEIYETNMLGEVMKNGDTKIIQGIKIEAVPAYNLTREREKFHPTGRDNGYVLNFGNRRVYIAGDTEDIPEMAFLKNIYIAFLPMNQPYTMLPEQVVKAVDMFKPKILYPYHYGESNVDTLKILMKSQPQTEVKIKQMK